MVRTGRPKAEKPFDYKVTVKFKEEEYQIMVEYAEYLHRCYQRIENIRVQRT